MVEMVREPYGDNLLPAGTRGWVAVERTSGDVHVVPVSDGMYHLPDDCSCDPAIDLVTRVDDTLRIVYVHHSLDNREATEPQ
jgi:hypothetical protein